jgi:hypothetical protein
MCNSKVCVQSRQQRIAGGSGSLPGHATSNVFSLAACQWHFTIHDCYAAYQVVHPAGPQHESLLLLKGYAADLPCSWCRPMQAAYMPAPSPPG